jgi:hypothetical protein
MMWHLSTMKRRPDYYEIVFSHVCECGSVVQLHAQFEPDEPVDINGMTCDCQSCGRQHHSERPVSTIQRLQMTLDREIIGCLEEDALKSIRTAQNGNGDYRKWQKQMFDNEVF